MTEKHKNVVFLAIFWSLLVFGLYLAKSYNYLLFHTLAEFCVVIIACSIFVVVWNSRIFLSSDYLLFLGISYLFVASIDLLHTISYKGMNILAATDTNLATQLWIAARYLQSISLLISPIFLTKKIKPMLVFSLFSLITCLMLGTIFYWKTFPECFIEGKGLTAFKIYSEYLIMLILLGAACFLFVKRNFFRIKISRNLLSSIFLLIASEAAFTMYTSPYGYVNFVGHICKLISFYLIYKTLIETGLRNPFDLIFKDLKESEQSLLKIRDVLEKRINERTQDLSNIIETLQTEVVEKINAENELKEKSKLLEAFFKHSITPLLFLDTDFKIIRANEACIKYFKKNHDELTGCNFFDLSPSDENKEIFRQVVISQKPYLADGKLIWFQNHPEWGNTYWDMSLVPILSEDGKVEFLVLSLEDVTKTKKEKIQKETVTKLLELFAEKTSQKTYLDEVVRLLQSWTNCRCIGIRVTNAKKHIPYEASIGYSDEFLAHESNLSIDRDKCVCIRVITKDIHPQEKHLVTEKGSFVCGNTQKFIESLKPHERPLYRGKCIEAGFISVAIVPIVYRNNLLGAIHMTDENEEKTTPEVLSFVESIAPLIGEAIFRFGIELELRQSEERYRRLVELSPYGIGVETEGKIVYLNAAAAKILGTDYPAAVIGRNLMDFIHPDFAQRAKKLLKYLRNKKKELAAAESKFLNLHGAEVDVEVAAMPLVYKDKPSNLIVFKDITETKKASERILTDQKQLRLLTTELILTEESERHVIATALHDSLGQILSYTKRELGILQKSMPAQHNPAMDNIRSLITQAIGQTRSLTFDLSPPTLYTLGFEHALEELVDKFSTEKDIKCNFSCPQENIPLSDDLKVLFYRSIRELLINIDKYADAKRVDISVARTETGVQITLEDDGKGFDTGALDPNKGKINGFGLLSIKERLTYLGGEFIIDSTVGKGTAITLIAPLRSTKSKRSSIL